MGEGGLLMMTETKNKVLTRDEVKVEETWRLEDIFATDEAWEKEYAEVEEFSSKADSYKGTLSGGGDALYTALAYRDALSERLRRLYTYAHLKTDQDTTNSFYQAMDSRVKSLYVKVATALSFFLPELLSIDETELDKLVTEHEGLALYKQEFEEINTQRPHVLPAEQEALLAQLSEVTGNSSETFSMLNNADLTFPMVKDEKGEEVELSHGRYVGFLESDDPRVREDAFKAMYSKVQRIPEHIRIHAFRQCKRR